MSFTSREFRDALGLFPTGVAVVTASDESGNKVGVTVNSFASVSLDPPLVLVGLARTLRSFAVFESTTAFVVNLLHESQNGLSTSFATGQADKWRGVAHRLGPAACPILHPNLAAFECAVHARYDGGDHMLMLGRVLSIERSSDARSRPLVYFRGRYGAVAEHLGEAAPLPLEGW